MSDVNEQSARLNTLLRFHQYREALPYAYKYRLDLQLTHPQGERTRKSLKEVEDIIETLERLKTPKWKVLVKTAWNSIGDAFTGRKSEQPPAPLIPEPSEETSEEEQQA